MTIAENLAEQLQRINAACAKAKRDPETVQLIAVSKLKPIEAIVEAYEAGQRHFGENYVQELLKKREALKHLSDLHFHLIGALQTKKSRQIVDQVSSIQTIDSLKLIAELQKRAMAKRSPGMGPLRVMIEVNLSQEDSKAGCSRDLLPELIQATLDAEALQLNGLMTIAPGTRDSQSARQCFNELAQLKEQFEKSEPRITTPLELSMGMSGDLEEAICAGATQVRIGRAIFGEREPKATSST